jgi:hypothetical protein
MMNDDNTLAIVHLGCKISFGEAGKRDPQECYKLTILKSMRQTLTDVKLEKNIAPLF